MLNLDGRDDPPEVPAVQQTIAPAPPAGPTFGQQVGAVFQVVVFLVIGAVAGDYVLGYETRAQLRAAQSQLIVATLEVEKCGNELRRVRAELIAASPKSSPLVSAAAALLGIPAPIAEAFLSSLQQNQLPAPPPR